MPGAIYNILDRPGGLRYFCLSLRTSLALLFHRPTNSRGI